MYPSYDIHVAIDAGRCTADSQQFTGYRHGNGQYIALSVSRLYPPGKHKDSSRPAG